MAPVDAVMTGAALGGILFNLSLFNTVTLVVNV